jgi:hypothetical protein
VSIRKPTPSLAELRRLHRDQQYPADLGGIVAPRRVNVGRLWRVAAAAALLALGTVIGWWLVPADDPPIAERSGHQVQALKPRLDTLELPIAPSGTGPTPAAAAGRRPVLPGMLTANDSARTPRLGARLRVPPTPSPPRIFASTHSQTHDSQEPLQ